jgi:site-specific recombinase XerD
VAFSARSAQAIDRYLRRVRKDAQDTDPLFTGRYRTRLDRGGVGDMLHRRSQEAGLKERIWPHRLRHTAATMLADFGIQEGELRQIMGWSPTSSMPFHYTQSTLAKRARDAQRRASVLDKLLD